MQYVIEVDAENKYENCDVYAAMYDRRNKVIAVKSVPLDTSITLDKNSEGKKIKVFLWTNAMQSLTDTAKEFAL